jgi:hypothetical protein
VLYRRVGGSFFVHNKNQAIPSTCSCLLRIADSVFICLRIIKCRLLLGGAVPMALMSRVIIDSICMLIIRMLAVC